MTRAAAATILCLCTLAAAPAAAQLIGPPSVDDAAPGAPRGAGSQTDGFQNGGPTNAPTNAQASEADALYLEAYAAYQVNDYARARSLALEAALQGHQRAHVLGGFLVERGLGGPQDDTQAVRLYRTAAASGDGEALFALGVLARAGRGGLAPEAALDYFTNAAGLGLAGARVEMAMLYADGVGVARDTSRARVILGQAALEGSSAAQRALGLLLLTTATSEAELHEAETWLTSAAADGDIQAAYALGVAYSTGEDFKTDDAKAARYLRQAAEAGDAAAAADYGLVLYQGRGVETSLEDAATWFRRAAQSGDQEGQFLYAFALAKGEGVERDLAEAYYWALRSAARGPSTALNYEVDRYNLITALEQTLDEETRDAVRERAGTAP